MSLFSKTWAEMTPEEQKAFDARLMAAKARIGASSVKPKSPPVEPAYLRDGDKPVEWRGRVVS